MITLIGRWFVQTSVPQDYRRFDYAILTLVLAAGALLRFWGLGDFSLHGDERHMATPAMAILETGQPILPSGMYYSRALAHLYLMAGSVWIFGESEWAFRLPSAIVGSLTGLAAFFMGRRFLAPHFNIAFVATITFLPVMIAISQHARMYVFLVTCLIWFAACLFRWEQDQRLSSLVLALFTWVLALHFQQLAIFAAPLFFYPGLSRQSWKQVVQGGFAFGIGAAIFRMYTEWMSQKFSSNMQRLSRSEPDATYSAVEAVSSGMEWLVLAAAVLAAIVVFGAFIKFTKILGWRSAMPLLAVGSGLIAMLLLHYHIGGILLILGSVFWLRQARLANSWLLGALCVAGLITVVHLILLHGTGIYPGRKLIGALVGTPSVWPILRFLEYSPSAGVIYGIVLVTALIRFARGQLLPMHFLFFCIAVWVPLLILGYFTWYMPPRYAQGQLGYFLLCTFAGLMFLMRDHERMPATWRASPAVVAGLVLVTVALVNPFALARTINSDASSYPDHKGAAQYIDAVDPDRKAVLIAEEAAHQAYYLGDVDYWLREFNNARNFAFVRDGRVLDVYTGAEIIGTGMELEAVLDANAGREVYVIGSGESFVNGKRLFRGQGIAEVLASPRLEVVYEGRDGKTKVWRLQGE